MNHSRSKMWIFFSKNVVLSMMVHLFFAKAFDSNISISIAPSCASINAYTCVDDCTFTMTMLSSLASICTIYASTNYYSTALSSSDSSMNTQSINVALGFVYALTHQCLLLLRKNSTIDVPIWFISWIIVCANCIFSLYVFPSTHFKDDEKCNDNFTTNEII